LFQEIRFFILAFVEGMAEDSDEKVPHVVVGAGTRSPRDVKQILQGQWVKVYGVRL